MECVRRRGLDVSVFKRELVLKARAREEWQEGQRGKGWARQGGGHARALPGIPAAVLRMFWDLHVDIIPRATLTGAAAHSTTTTPGCTPLGRRGNYGFRCGSIAHRQRLPKVKPGSGSSRWEESKRFPLNHRIKGNSFGLWAVHPKNS